MLCWNQKFVKSTLCVNLYYFDIQISLFKLPFLLTDNEIDNIWEVT